MGLEASLHPRQEGETCFEEPSLEVFQERKQVVYKKMVVYLKLFLSHTSLLSFPLPLIPRNIYYSTGSFLYLDLSDAQLCAGAPGGEGASRADCGSQGAPREPCQTRHRCEERCLSTTFGSPNPGFNSHLPNLQLGPISVLPKMAFLVVFTC